MYRDKAYLLGLPECDIIQALFYNLHPHAWSFLTLCHVDDDNPYDKIALALAETFPERNIWYLDKGRGRPQ